EECPKNIGISEMKNLKKTSQTPKDDDDGKPLENVAFSCDYDSEDEVAAVDNDMAKFLAKKDGYGTQSLLEQWTKSYENGGYGYDPYKDDMYEGQDIPEKLQAICDKLDITVRGRRKKEFSCIIVSFIVGIGMSSSSSSSSEMTITSSMFQFNKLGLKNGLRLRAE
ncbi:hypothetical protein Tco_1198060, partial [Tanacetum coccineum]